jgi:hypothetical protein
MKSYFTFSALFFLSFTGRTQPPAIEFSTYTPRWIHVIQDTNFIEGPNENLNSFSSVYPLYNPVVDEEFGYIPFLCNNGNTNRDGAVMIKVQNDNGQIVWSNFMNTSNGDDQNYYTSFYVNDKIHLSGRKRTQRSIELQEPWQIGGHSKPFCRILDKNTGQIEKEIFDMTDTIGQFLGFSLKILFPLHQKIKQLERLNQGVLLSDLDNNLVHVVRSQLLPYPAGIPSAYQHKSRTAFIRENDQQCYVYFHSVSKDTSIHNHIGLLNKYVLDTDSLLLHTTVDFSQYIKTVPLSGIRDRFYYNFSANGGMVITQTYQESTSPVYRNWLLKFNASGEVETYVENLHLADKNHTYEVGIPIYSDNQNVFLFGFPSSTGERGIDIIQVTKAGEVLLKGNLTTGSSTKLGIGGVAMNSNGDIVFSFQWEQKYAAMMGMHISDFGINLSSDDEKAQNQIPLMTLSPNPASDDVALYITEEQYYHGTVYIYNLAGQIVFSQKITSGEIMDTRALPPGQYIVQYLPDSHPGYFLTTKLVKN